ncbi:MAG: helix-turn-helix domain-containing protein [bacterium]|jgi:transcriptional regulator with XRE-family HTH domain
MSDKDLGQEKTPVLVEIGVLLKETREDKGLSLELVQEETKIRRYYLEALEQGKKELLPGDVYLKGFLKNYACFLDLPGEELVRQYSQSQDAVGKDVLARATYRAPAGKHIFGRILMPAMLLVVLVMVGFWLTKNPQTPDAEPVAPPAADSEPLPSIPGIPNGEEQEENWLTESIIQTEVDTATEVVYRVIADSLQLEMEVTSDRCWVAVRIDNLPETSETIAAGDIRTLSATDRIWLRAGNPRVLKLTVNGTHLGVAGLSGQPRNIIFELQTNKE